MSCPCVNVIKCSICLQACNKNGKVVLMVVLLQTIEHFGKNASAVLEDVTGISLLQVFWAYLPIVNCSFYIRNCFVYYPFSSDEKPSPTARCSNYSKAGRMTHGCEQVLSHLISVFLHTLTAQWREQIYSCLTLSKRYSGTHKERNNCFSFYKPISVKV